MIKGNDKDLHTFDLAAENETLKKQLKIEKDKYASLLVKAGMEIATLKSLLKPVNDTTTDFIDDIFNNSKN